MWIIKQIMRHVKRAGDFLVAYTHEINIFFGEVSI